MVYPLDDIRTLVLIRAVAGLIGKPPIQRKVAWNLDNTFAAIILKR